MRVRRFSATLLLGMLLSPSGGPVTFERLVSSTLEPSQSLRIDWETYNFHPVDEAAGMLAVRTKDAVEIVDEHDLRVVRTYPLRVRRGDVCALGFDGADPVALLGCRDITGRYTIVRLDAPARQIPVRRNIGVIRYPVSFAFGDGRVFVSRGFGAVDAIDLRAGTVASHRPPRTLAKGEGFVRATWLGDHLLGLGGTVVDVRTWTRRTLAPHATETTASGRWLTTYGNAGVAVFTRDLRLYRRYLRRQVVDQARIVGDVLYARVALVWHEIDVRTGRELARLVPDAGEDLSLL